MGASTSIAPTQQSDAPVRPSGRFLKALSPSTRRCLAVQASSNHPQPTNHPACEIRPGEKPGERQSSRPSRPHIQTGAIHPSSQPASRCRPSTSRPDHIRPTSRPDHIRPASYRAALTATVKLSMPSLSPLPHSITSGQPLTITPLHSISRCTSHPPSLAASPVIGHPGVGGTAKAHCRPLPIVLSLSPSTLLSACQHSSLTSNVHKRVHVSTLSSKWHQDHRIRPIFSPPQLPHYLPPALSPESLSRSTPRIATYVH